MNDYLISIIRTAVPAGVAAVLAWLASRWSIVLDDESSVQLTVAAVAVATAVYHGLVRALESRWPWWGKLLGAAKTPRYRPAMPEAARVLGARNGR